MGIRLETEVRGMEFCKKTKAREEDKELEEGHQAQEGEEKKEGCSGHSIQG